VQALNIAQVADELYALVPGEFIAARDELAQQARSAGDRDLSAAIKQLRRPTVSAWLVNRLVREAADELDELLAMGEALREAQRTLAGERLRDLSAERRQRVGVLVQQAKRLAADAGQAIGAQVEREVAATLEAALADPGAADAVRSGRLNSALSYSGLGAIDVSAAVALPGAPRERAPERALRIVPGGGGPTGTRERAAERARPGPRAVGRTAGETAEERRARAAEAAERRAQEAEARRRAREAEAAEAAERDLRDATEMAQEAQAVLNEAEQRLAGLRGEHRATQARIEELERQLGELEAERTRLSRDIREAQRSRDAAGRSLDAAQRRLARAQDHVGKRR